jgi:glycosyltransferase involved in cell wall biosynthesis
MKVSIIVPTLNRSALLRSTIVSLIAQTFPADDFEIIVIDNGSTDSTGATVESLRGEHPKSRLRYFYEPEPGLLSGRHRGALEATGEILVFTDDDIEAAPGWLAAIVSGFDDPQVQLLGGKNLPKYESAPPAWIEEFWEDAPGGGRYCFYLSLLDLGDQRRPIEPWLIFGLNFSIRAKTLRDLGGFHPDGLPAHLQQFRGNGETGLALKAGERGLLALYEPKATVFHFTPASRLTLEYFSARSYTEGVSDSYTRVRANGLPADLTTFRKMRRLAGKVKRWTKAALFGPPDIHIRLADARRAGFEFHQRAVRTDPKVLDWVQKPDYWDYLLPR